MRKSALILGLLLIISAASAFEIRIEGYDGGNVTVRLIPMGNGSAENITVQDNVITLQNITNGSYHVVVTYKDMQYIGNIIIPDNESLVVNFSWTSDPSVLKIDNIHYIVNYQNEGFAILEVINFENTADTYYRGDIIKKIPPDATHVIVDDSGLKQAGVVYENVTQEGDAIIIKNATVQPHGMFSLAYIYFPSGDLRIVVDYPTDIIRIIHSAQIEVTAPNQFVQETQFADANGQVFTVLKATNVSKGETFTITAELLQNPGTGTEGAGKSKNLLDNPAVIAGILLVVAGVALYLYSGRNGKGGKKEDSGGWEIRDE